MGKCKYCGLDAGTHTCDPKDVTINMKKKDISILRQQVTALEARNKELEALAEQPTQEPVARMVKQPFHDDKADIKSVPMVQWLKGIIPPIDTLLYTHPNEPFTDGDYICPSCGNKSLYKTEKSEWCVTHKCLYQYDYPPKQWQGLSDDEIHEQIESASIPQYQGMDVTATNLITFARAIEAKLREKNNE